MNILLYSSVLMNIVSYIHRCYILWLLHRLTEEYNIYSSVMKVFVFSVVYGRLYTLIGPRSRLP
jgi:hypothetical protein